MLISYLEFVKNCSLSQLSRVVLGMIFQNATFPDIMRGIHATFGALFKMNEWMNEWMNVYLYTAHIT